MNDSRSHDDEHEPWRERLLDQALNELIASETPPDLTDAILAKSEEVVTMSVETNKNEAGRNSSSWRNWMVVFTAAACAVLMVGLWSPDLWRSQWDLAMGNATVAESSAVDVAEDSESVLVSGVEDGTGPDNSERNERWNEGAKSQPDSSFVLGSEQTVSDPEADALSQLESMDQNGAASQNSSMVILEQEGIQGTYTFDENGQPANPEVLSDFELARDESSANTSSGSEGAEVAGPDAASGGYPGDGYGLAQTSPGTSNFSGGGLGGMRRTDSLGSVSSSTRQLSSEAKKIAQLGGQVQGRGSSLSNLAEASRRRKSESLSIVPGPAAMPANTSRGRGGRGVNFRLPVANEAIVPVDAESLSKHRESPDGRNRDGRRYYYLYEGGRGKTLPERQASRDRYAVIQEKAFVTTKGAQAVSTFSIDVDTASYTNTRQYLLQQNQLPPANAVRIEEFVNYFEYDYAGPKDDTPFAAHIEVAGCPWESTHRLVRVGIKGREIERNARPDSNLVFLVDVSGSMNDPDKLPLVVEGLEQLTQQLGENDKVAIVVYASKEGLVLPSTRGHNKEAILSSLTQLRAGGSTAGGAGIQLAYRVAEENFISNGTNRVILCTDGDFNVGVSDTSSLAKMAEDKAKSGVFLTVLGFGRGNLNDEMMESISNKGNGNYHYVDNGMEARKVLVRQMSGTLVTIAKDVKIQVEFNPSKVSAYRLIGYENRMLARQDFEDDTKDAGEIGAGHSVTALYEVVPIGQAINPTGGGPLKYQQPAVRYTVPVEKGDHPGADSDEMLELRIRYKQPTASTSNLLKFPVTDEGKNFRDASLDFRFASSVAGFGMLLRNSKHKGNATFDSILEIAEAGAKRDEYGYRSSFVDMIRRAKQLRRR